ncbi:hypothetical protein ACH3VR_12175 [Microbacterium sp. B2969]|uniref:Proteinase inhibitor I42 chagasin domain-containing protein n=1 Tax=Microbacterium alkaliflavum TaxID=3248839 RepID=A0ABW7Q9J6_9MICO
MDDRAPEPPAQPEPDAVGTVGAPFALPLPAGAATGAEWRLELPEGLRPAGESDASAPGEPGDPIDALPLVVADEAGAYQVVAHLIRPWDASVLRTVTLQVAVR